MCGKSHILSERWLECLLKGAQGATSTTKWIHIEPLLTVKPAESKSQAKLQREPQYQQLKLVMDVRGASMVVVRGMEGRGSREF